jgi:uncharacterized membrane-anchored protein
MSTTLDDLPRTDFWGWIRAHQRAVILATIAFQMVVLGSMVVQHGFVLATGDSILLRVRPVDPRDPLRGDYVILRYDFSGMWPQGSGSWDESKAGAEIFVTLEPEPDGKHWRGVSASWERPSSGRYIRGRVVNSWSHEFGIEAFYVQEGQGKEYEQARNANRLSAEIALTPDGTASLKRLVLE